MGTVAEEDVAAPVVAKERKNKVERIVSPEILDTLDGADPDALRSRCDLRMINFLMGNERWLLKQLSESSCPSSVIELGAGDGSLSEQMIKLISQSASENSPLTALDFQACPVRLQSQLESGQLVWKDGDLFQTLGESEGETVVANLILHHFQDDQLKALGQLLQKRKRLLIVEPLRSSLALVEGRLLFPFINRVTRHDMMVSIRAGFQNGELAQLLGLDESEQWEWREESTLLGGYRMVAWRINA